MCVSVYIKYASPRVHFSSVATPLPRRHSRGCQGRHRKPPIAAAVESVGRSVAGRAEVIHCQRNNCPGPKRNYRRPSCTSARWFIASTSYGDKPPPPSPFRSVEPDAAALFCFLIYFFLQKNLYKLCACTLVSDCCGGFIPRYHSHWHYQGNVKYTTEKKPFSVYITRSYIYINVYIMYT